MIVLKVVNTFRMSKMIKYLKSEQEMLGVT